MPNAVNAVAIMLGIARDASWEIRYFDTWHYRKGQDSMQDREASGEFKPCAGRPIGTKSAAGIPVEFQEAVDSFMPDVLAISCISSEYEFLMSWFGNVRISAGTTVVIGGMHAVLNPDAVIASGMFDVVCVGEGEMVFAEILRRKEHGDDLSGIAGTYFRDRAGGGIVRNERRRLLSSGELWKIKPDYSLFDERAFVFPFDGKLYRRFNFEGGRGCPFSCSYCGNAALKNAYKGLGPFLRLRPLDSVKAEVTRLISENGVELFYFQDECFLAHPLAWLEELAAWYGKEVRKPFIVQTRPETVTAEKIDLLKRMSAPFFQVSMGVESGSERILFDVCNRNTPIQEIIRAFDLLRERDVRTCAFFMLGFPYETREDVFKSITLCRRLRPTVAIASIFQPLPGQTLRDLCIREGFITGKEPLPTFTSDSILSMPQLSRSEIAGLRRCFMLYATLDEKHHPDIERCEKDYEGNKDLYEWLVRLRWESTG